MCRGYTDISDVEGSRSRRGSRCGSFADGNPPRSRRGSRFDSRCGTEPELDDGSLPAPELSKLDDLVSAAASAAKAAEETELDHVREAVSNSELTCSETAPAAAVATTFTVREGGARPASLESKPREGRRVAFSPDSPSLSSRPAVHTDAATDAAPTAASEASVRSERSEVSRSAIKLDSPVAERSATSSPSSASKSSSLKEKWTALEVELFRASNGHYNPTEMARRRRVGCSLPGSPFGTGSRLEVVGRVSMVTPTMSSRQKYHEAMWASFEAQTVGDKELIVLESYEDKPSAFLQAKAKEDSRLVHICIKVPAEGDFSVGLKRNMTLHLASGEYIVNFDDDDLYSAGYAEAMVSEMQLRSLHGVTLSSWHNFYTGTGQCTYSDPASWGEWASSEAELDAILFGYGFSYAHRRQVSLEYPYPDVCFAEDAPFFLKIREVFGEDKVTLKRDDKGLCMHIMHRANSAQVLGTRTISSIALRSLAVWDLEPFKRYLQAVPPQCSEEVVESKLAIIGVGDVIAATLQILGLTKKTGSAKVARRALRSACA